MYYPEGMKARVSPVQSIEPRRILAPTRDSNQEPPGPESKVVTNILPLHTRAVARHHMLSRDIMCRRATSLSSCDIMCRRATSCVVARQHMSSRDIMCRRATSCVVARHHMLSRDIICRRATSCVVVLSRDIMCRHATSCVVARQHVPSWCRATSCSIARHASTPRFWRHATCNINNIPSGSRVTAHVAMTCRLHATCNIIFRRAVAWRHMSQWRVDVTRHRACVCTAPCSRATCRRHTPLWRTCVNTN